MKHTIGASLLCISLISPLSGTTQKVQAEISYGELVDKITILKIKSERISDPDKLKNILTELTALLMTLVEQVGYKTGINNLMKELKQVNEILWDIEDSIRLKERDKDFNDDFVQLARSVYITNDQRFALKKKVDALFGSHISEEKSYQPYL